MNNAVKWGLILGVSVGVMGFVFAIAGFHQSPMVALAFVLLAVVINIVVVIVALRQTKADTAWGGQVLNGLVIGVVGAVLIFLSSWIMTGVVFPDYYDNMKDGYAEFFESAGMTEEQIDTQMAGIEKATPISGAIQGAVGTVITSVVVGAIAGFFLRKK